MAQTCELKEPPAAPAAAARCLVCGASGLDVFLDLGETPLANAFPASRTGPPQPCYPLRAARCAGCGHVQLDTRVPPEEMFTHYLYVSSASSTLSAHLDSLAAGVAALAPLREGDLAADIGSNDGTLLAAFGRRGALTVGIDPAANLAPLARSRGAHVEVSCFDAAAAARLLRAHGPARVITATNSFPHLQDPAGLLRGVDLLLDSSGVLVIEAHYLVDMLEQTAFDTIYHEHVSYWALTPLRRLLASHGLEVFRVERLPVHHGQLRVWASRPGARPVEPSVEETLAMEERAGLATPRPFEIFARKVLRLRARLRTLLDHLPGPLAAYGAPAKGMTLLSFLGLDASRIAFVADRSPLKQGRFTPGSRIPISAPARLLDERPPYTLLLAWNFVDEILTQLEPYTAAGGRLIVPVPEPRILP